MTPEEQIKKLTGDVERLQGDVRTLLAFMQGKKLQQISLPLDDQSRIIIGGVVDDGAGSSALTENRNLSGNPETITVPKAYTATRLIILDGTRYEIPIIAIL